MHPNDAGVSVETQAATATVVAMLCRALPHASADPMIAAARQLVEQQWTVRDVVLDTVEWEFGLVCVTWHVRVDGTSLRAGVTPGLNGELHLELDDVSGHFDRRVAIVDAPAGFDRLVDAGWAGYRLGGSQALLGDRWCDASAFGGSLPMLLDALDVAVGLPGFHDQAAATIVRLRDGWDGTAEQLVAVATAVASPA